MVDDRYVGGESPELQTFTELWNFYVNVITGDNTLAHHNQMAQSYVDAISRALQEFDTGTAVPQDEQPSQVYKDLAWGGLWMTDPYNALPEADRNRIDAVNEAEDTNTPVISPGGINTPVSTPCN